MQQLRLSNETSHGIYDDQVNAYQMQIANHKRSIQRLLQCSSGYLTTVSQETPWPLKSLAKVSWLASKAISNPPI